jgi:hypothetical protein
MLVIVTLPHPAFHRVSGALGDHHASIPHATPTTTLLTRKSNLRLPLVCSEHLSSPHHLSMDFILIVARIIGVFGVLSLLVLLVVVLCMSLSAIVQRTMRLLII